MQKRHSIWLGAAMAVAMTMPSFAEDVTGETVLATVNGDQITVGHMVASRLALPEQYQSLPDDVLFSGLLEQLIQQTVLSQTIGEVSNRTAIRLENERRALTAGEMLDDVMSKAVTEEALQQAYETEYADAEPTKEYNASHILVETQQEAKDLIALLEDGGDFTELAKEHSTGPSGPNGGGLGWFSTGMMVKPFEDAVMILDVGQISPPVETQFGWHVMKLTETRMKGAPELDEVREELADKLESDAVESAVNTLIEAATIDRTDLTDFDPAILRDVTLID